jgi:broad specificity phosphatase PhoE
LVEKNIYIIRHGETDYNKKGFLQGSSIDASLNEKGMQQADRFFQSYQHIPFDKVYTSALKRSQQSVKKFIDNIPFEQYEEFNEINWGELEGSQLTPISWIRLRRLAKKWKEGKTSLAIPGGESPDAVARRQKGVIDLILSRAEEKNILICMHGRAMRILICLLLEKSLVEMDTYKHSNLGLYVLQKEKNFPGFKIIEKNTTKHLY